MSRLHSTADDPMVPLVIRFGALGDVVLLTVLLEALWRRYGRPVQVLGSGAWTRQLLEHDPAVGRVELVTSRRMPHWLTPSRWRANAWLHAHRGPVYLCDPDAHAARIVARAAVAQDHLVRAWDRPAAENMHWADWWLDVAARDASGFAGPPMPAGVPAQPRLHVPAAWHDDAQTWLLAHGLAQRPLVLLQPGHKKTHKRGRLATSNHDKHWPAERWAAVARHVVRTLPGAAVLVCGSPREAPLAQAVVTAAGNPGDARIVNAAAHALTLPRLAGIAARAHSMVSVDTGPAHVAAALDCPLVVLFGRYGSARWRPRAPNACVTALGPLVADERASVMDIAVDQVIDAWTALGTSPSRDVNGATAAARGLGSNA